MLLRIARMARLAGKYRDPAWVSRGSVGWVQRFRGGTVITPTLHGPPLRMLEATTLDLFCFHYSPKAGDTVVELGAEFGTETLFLSRMVGPSGRVLAVEAHPDTCDGLREMVRLNGLTNVEVVHAAITGETGTTTITDGNAVSNTVGRGDIEVPAFTLGDLLDKYDVRAVDLLKVNIEGAEAPLLSSLDGKTGAMVRHAVVSCHDFRADRGDGEFYRTGDQVDSDLGRLGFTVERRPDDARAWARHYRYASRVAAAVSDAGVPRE